MNSTCLIVTEPAKRASNLRVVKGCMVEPGARAILRVRPRSLQKISMVEEMPWV